MPQLRRLRGRDSSARGTPCADRSTRHAQGGTSDGPGGPLSAEVARMVWRRLRCAHGRGPRDSVAVGNGRVMPADVEGATFTITNPGQFGAVFGLPIINQPNVAIMGVGGITKQPMVITDKDGADSIAIRSVVHLTLGYDHRIVDGAMADQFMAVVKKALENWSEEVG